MKLGGDSITRHVATFLKLLVAHFEGPQRAVRGLVVAGPLMFAAALFLEHDEDTDCPRLAEIGRDWTRLDGTGRGCWPVLLLEHDKDAATVD